MVVAPSASVDPERTRSLPGFLFPSLASPPPRGSDVASVSSVKLNLISCSRQEVLMHTHAHTHPRVHTPTRRHVAARRSGPFTSGARSEAGVGAGVLQVGAPGRQGTRGTTEQFRLTSRPLLFSRAAPGRHCCHGPAKEGPALCSGAKHSRRGTWVGRQDAHKGKRGSVWGQEAAPSSVWGQSNQDPQLWPRGPLLFLSPAC